MPEYDFTFSLGVYKIQTRAGRIIATCLDPTEAERIVKALNFFAAEKKKEKEKEDERAKYEDEEEEEWNERGFKYFTKLFDSGGED